MEYAGYQPPPGCVISSVEGHLLTPQAFHSQYVAKRRPVLIHGHPSDAGWHASALWDDAYLQRHAGMAPVLVEKRDNCTDSFGRGRRLRMTFGALLTNLSSGDDSCYMTSQQVPVAADGHPELFTHPLLELTSDFEPRPLLAGNLVPQQVNLWCGAARQGASSGLHHDFHDNLYILLRGRKRFRLFDPSQAPNMYTHGKLQRVHANGRIVYQGQGDVRADGADEGDAVLSEARAAAEAAVAVAEAAVTRKEKGAARRLAAAERQLEQVLEAELDAAFDFDGGDSDDEDQSDNASEDGSLGDELDEETTEQAVKGRQSRLDATLQRLQQTGAGSANGAIMADAATPATDSAAKNNGSVAVGKLLGVSTNGKFSGKGDSVKVGSKAAAAQTDELIVDSEDPLSFSAVDLSAPAAATARRFPRFPGLAAAMEVEVVAGDMLYLPCGWFHEVTSFSSSGGSSKVGEAATASSKKVDKAKATGGVAHSNGHVAVGAAGSIDDRSNIHLALNYWFHPPDNLSPNSYSHPYTSDYWPSLWASRQGSLAPPAPSTESAAAVQAIDDGGGKGRKRATTASAATATGASWAKKQRGAPHAAADLDSAVTEAEVRALRAEAAEAASVAGAAAGGSEEAGEINIGKEIMESMQRDVPKDAIAAAFKSWLQEKVSQPGGLEAALQAAANVGLNEPDGAPYRRKRRLGRRHHRSARVHRRRQ